MVAAKRSIVLRHMGGCCLKVNCTEIIWVVVYKR